jgi:hypothetical protein
VKKQKRHFLLERNDANGVNGPKEAFWQDYVWRRKWGQLAIEWPGNGGANERNGNGRGWGGDASRGKAINQSTGLEFWAKSRGQSSLELGEIYASPGAKQNVILRVNGANSKMDTGRKVAGAHRSISTQPWGDKKVDSGRRNWQKSQSVKTSFENHLAS